MKNTCHLPAYNFENDRCIVKKKTSCRPGGEGGNGPPEGKFTKLGGKVILGCCVRNSML